MSKVKDFFNGCTKAMVSPKPTEIVVLQSTSDPQSVAPDLAHLIGEHYTTEKILRKWGREKLANYVARKTPTTKMGKSGDLGEILATEYINTGVLKYEVPINRLRWKDSRELPMRGEDVIGFIFDVNPMLFLKAEAKSRQTLAASVIALARAALEKNLGLPLPHTLSFIVERLYEANQDGKANSIEEYVTNKSLDRSQVAHLMFTFSGNDPTELLKEDLKSIKKGTTHYSVGLQVKEHQTLIESVYKKAYDG